MEAPLQKHEEKDSPSSAPLERDERLIIITGFGPFVGHEKVNASWEAVRLLPSSISFQNCEYRIEKLEIPVKYAEVDAAVEAIWSANPMLVIHCGVHGGAKCVHIEKSAYNHQFRRPDYTGAYLKNHSAALNCTNNKDAAQKDILACRLDLDKLSEIVQGSCECLPKQIGTDKSSSSSSSSPTKKEKDIESAADDAKSQVCCVSYDVGDYLCGYIYLKSLDYNDLRTLFVHVPPVEKFPPEFTKNIIMKILEECLRQLVEDFPECKVNL